MKQTHFGWTKDAADDRDHIFSSAAAAAPGTAADLSTSPYEPPVSNQLPLHSCAAHAVGAMVQFVRAKEALEPIAPSRLFIYYNARKIEGTTASDAGASIRNGIKTVVQTGICPESLWPYDTAKFADAPPQSCYDAAVPHHALSYARMEGIAALRACLGSGYPFVFGMNIFSEFTTPTVAQTGIFPMPELNGKTLGGHAVMAVGYDDARKTFRVRNSVGTAWGMNGYFTVPYTFMQSRQCSDDFWTIRTAS